MWSEHEQFATQQNRPHHHIDDTSTVPSPPDQQPPLHGSQQPSQQQQPSSQQQFVPPPYYPPYWNSRMPPTQSTSVGNGTPTNNMPPPPPHHGIYSNYRMHHDIMQQSPPRQVIHPQVGGFLTQDHLPGLSAPPGLLPPPPPGLSNQTIFDDNLPSEDLSEQHLVMLVNSLRQQGGSFLPQITSPLFRLFSPLVDPSTVGITDPLNKSDVDLQSKLSLDGGDIPPGLSFPGSKDDISPSSAVGPISPSIMKDHAALLHHGHSPGSAGMFVPSVAPPPYMPPQGTLPDWLRSHDGGGQLIGVNGRLMAGGSGELVNHPQQSPHGTVMKSSSFGSNNEVIHQ